MAEVHDPHRKRDLVAFCSRGVAVPVPSLVGKAERFANIGSEIEPLDQHVAHFAAGREVVDRPVVSAFLERPHDLFVLLRGTSGDGELHHGVEDLSRIRDVEHQCLGEDGDVILEDGRDLVRVASAPDVAQQ